MDWQAVKREPPEMRTEHPLLARDDGGMPYCVEDIEGQIKHAGRLVLARTLGWTFEDDLGELGERFASFCSADDLERLVQTLGRYEVADTYGWTLKELEELLATPRTPAAPDWRIMGEPRQN